MNLVPHSTFAQDYKAGKRAKSLAREELAQLSERLAIAERTVCMRKAMPPDMPLSAAAITHQKTIFSGKIWHLISEIPKIAADGNTATTIAAKLGSLVADVRHQLDEHDTAAFAGMMNIADDLVQILGIENIFCQIHEPGRYH